MPRIKSIFVNLSVLLVTMIVMLVLVELVLRLTNLAPGASVPTVSQKEFESVPGIFKPGVTLTDSRNQKLPFDVEINQLGYRNKNFQIQKPIGERQMIERALPLSPDLVLLVMFRNDIEDMADPMWNKLAENRRIKSSFPMSWIHATLGKTALWSFALKIKFLLSRERLDQVEGEPSDEEIARKEQLRLTLQERYKTSIAELQNYLSENEVSFAVAVYPSHHTMRDPSFRPALEWADTMFNDAGITTINLLEPLENSGHSIEDLHLLPIDGHPSVLGYEIAAKHLAGELFRQLDD